MPEEVAEGEEAQEQVVEVQEPEEEIEIPEPEVPLYLELKPLPPPSDVNRVTRKSRCSLSLAVSLRKPT